MELAQRMNLKCTHHKKEMEILGLSHLHIKFRIDLLASLVAQMIQSLSTMWETWVWPWVGKISWKRKWLPTPVFLPGEFHGREAWWATVHRVMKGQTHLKRQHNGTRSLDLHFLNVEFKTPFSLSSFPSLRGSLVLLLSAIRVISSAYLRLLIFLPAILIPACDLSSSAFRWCTLHIS